MTDPSAAAKRKKYFVRLGVAAILLGVAAGLALKELHPLLDLIGRGVAVITRLGPWAFFAAMAIMPALGVPSSVFTLTAGSAFGAQLGMAWVVAWGVVATSINIAFTYALARWAIRGWLQRLLVRFGYKLPEVGQGDMTDLIVFLRVTTGIPLCVQNYLLGLADAPAGRYFAISFVLGWPNVAAYIWFGDALLHGRGKMIMGGLTLIVLLTVATHFLRRHFGRRKAAAA
jgi:uncharacterized membrane protein YdjX (TVP38/TMEM64 family)